jgi:ferrous iron transport protein B
MFASGRQVVGGKLGHANYTIALCGNPNSGKTTLFNALTGFSQKVANYPGVTVEKVTGMFRLGDRKCNLVDIPGAYSLSAHSPDEAIAADALIGRIPGEPEPDLAVIVVDATNLQRGLYLVLQVLELQVPVVVALNMYDIAQRHGIRIDHHALARELGVAVVPIVANRSEGTPDLLHAMARAAATPAPEFLRWPVAIEDKLERVMRASETREHSAISRGGAVRLLFDEQPVRRNRSAQLRGADFVSQVQAIREELAAEGALGLEAQTRARQAVELARRVCERPSDPDASRTSRVDRFVLHRILGPIILVALMVAVFQSIFVWAQPLIEVVDTGFAWVSDAVRSTMPAGPLRSLLADGVIGGVGAVLVFLPQIMILFFFIGVMEDSGYMPRAAFLVDSLFKGCGLSGRSLIPLLSSFACAVPGIMATRTIDNRRQRLLTIMVAPLMTCSARLPVYAILIAAFVPAVYIGIFSLQGLTLAALYALGLLVAAVVALILKSTVLRGPVASFVMELPSYKWPTWSNVFMQMWQRGVAFVTRAGTVILALTIVLWALSYYPRPATAPDPAGTVAASESPLPLQSEILANSYLGRMGRFLEPASIHLGWDWKLTMAVIAAFPAREVVIATLGTIYNLGDDDLDNKSTLIAKLRKARWEYGPLAGQPVYNLPVAASILVFFALCSQCMATLATIRRETDSWRWPSFVFVYMTALAVAGAYFVYQGGMALGWGGTL